MHMSNSSATEPDFPRARLVKPTRGELIRRGCWRLQLVVGRASRGLSGQQGTKASPPTECVAQAASDHRRRHVLKSAPHNRLHEYDAQRTPSSFAPCIKGYKSSLNPAIRVGVTGLTTWVGDQSMLRMTNIAVRFKRGMALRMRGP